MEKTNNHPPLLTEILSNWLTKAFRVHRVPFLASLFWGVLAYMFAFTNKLVNHDEVGQLFAKGATHSSGRWGLGALDLIFPNVSMPWIYGIITMLCIAVAICLIIDIFSIRSKPLQVLLSASIMVFPSLIGVFGYMFTSSCYGVSFLLAVLSIWVLCRPWKLAVLPALACLIGSVSIYQAYISVAASLLVLVLIQKLLVGEDPLLILKKGIGYVLFLIVGLGGYYLLTRLIMITKHIPFNEYAADSISFSISYLPKGIRLAYSSFFQFFYMPYFRLIPTEFSQKLHILLLAVAAILLLLWALKQKKPCATRFLLLLALIGVLPLAVNCLYMITVETSIHTLVLYSFIAVYILIIMLADLFAAEMQTKKLAELLRRLCVDCIALVMVVVIMINVYTANAAYLNMHLRYENTYSFFTSLTAQIRQMPEFKEGTKLAVIGIWKYPDFYEQHLEFTYYLTGVGGFMPTTYTAYRFMEYYIGFPAVFASAEEMAAIQQTEEFQNMPLYPYYGSIGVINDTIVVKLSE